MSDPDTTSGGLKRELADAHAQLIDRDQRIQDLSRENISLRTENVSLRTEIAFLRTHLEAVLATRAWRAAESFRALRAKLRPGR